MTNLIDRERLRLPELLSLIKCLLFEEAADGAGAVREVLIGAVFLERPS